MKLRFTHTSSPSLLCVFVFTTILTRIDPSQCSLTTNIDCALTHNQTIPFYTEHTQDLKLLYDFQQFLCLVGKRLQIGRNVAVYKWLNKKAIFDPIREQSILALVVARATACGLGRTWSTHFFQNQMEANRKIQEYLFYRWKCANVKLVVDSTVALDLYNTIRPQLDRINGQLIQLAHDTRSLRASKWCIPLTEFHATNFEHELSYDPNEAVIFQDFALRNVCVVDN